MVRPTLGPGLAIANGLFHADSPPIAVNATGLGLRDPGLLYLQLLFVNNDRNLQIALPEPVHLAVSVQWSSQGASPPPAVNLSSPGTNAVAVRYGPLVFALPLSETRQVEQVWTPFNNTDISITTTSTWSFALVVDAPMTFAWHPRPTTMPLPFNISNYPATVTVQVVPIPQAWTTATNAAAEPPTSPIDCTSMQCGPTQTLQLVPYGATDIRVTAFPWVTQGSAGRPRES